MRVFVRALGELLLTGGFLVLLFAGYELWGTGMHTQREQDALATDLRRAWNSGKGVTGTPLGDGIAVVRIPQFGANYHYVAVQGVGVEDLKKGPGHYPGTAMPGQTGNFVLSGHRTTYSAPFNRLNELENGSPIVIETRNFWYVYRVTQKKIVSPSAIEVTAPVPGRPDAKPRNRRITLTTCDPKYSAAQRLIVHGQLDVAQRKSTGPPAVLIESHAGG